MTSSGVKGDLIVPNLEDRIAELVAAVRENIMTQEQGIQHLGTVVDGLCDAMRRKSQFGDRMIRLEIAYFPDSFNGRKACFGIGGDTDAAVLYRSLICAGSEQRFLHHLTTQVFPRWMVGEHGLPAFHF